MAERQRDVVLNFRMNGQVQYAQTLKQINMVMQTAAKEYTNQIQAMGKNASQTEKLRAEKQKLQTQMTASSEKVRMLREEFEAMSNDSSATAEDLQKLYNKLLTAENAHTKLEQAMERVNAGLTEEAIAAREAQGELNKLKDDANTLEAEQRRLTSAFELQRAQLGENATEADRAALAQEQYTQQMNIARRAVDNLEQQLEATRRAYGENSVEVMQLETRLNQARSEMTRFSRGLDDVEESAEGAESKLGMLGRGAQALAGALPAAAVAGLAESTKELSTELSRLQSNAETWGFTGGKIEESFKKVAAVSGDTGAAVETVSNLMATGFDDNQLAEAIEYVNGAYVQFSDTLSTEGIADGIQETFAVGEAAGSFAELLERSGMSLETFNEGLAKAKKNGSETDYVLQTLSDTGVKSFYESYQQSNKALIEANEAEVEHQLALKELGDTLRPLVTDVTQFTTKIIEWASENPELTKGIVITTTAIGALVAVGAVLAPIFTAIATTAGAAGISVGALMATILPIIAIAAAVVAAIIGIVYAVKNWGAISDWLSKKWDQFTSWISKTTSKLAKDFVKWFNNMKDGAVEKVDELKVKAVRKVVELTFDAVRKGQELKTKFVNKANEMKDGAISKFNSLRDGASRVMNQAKDKILSPIQSAKEKISGIVSDIKGFFTGMKLSIPKIKMPRLPKFTISGDFGLNPPRVPKIGIKWNAKGAIFTQPTIFGMNGGMLQGAGEAGPEAALPLNNETLGAIGRGIASTMGTRQPMIIQMVTPDRRVLAEMVVDDITEIQEFNQDRKSKFSKG
ncbi:hypothetical protein LIS77_06660 [Cytobacillus firmus]|uniref:hypothetical protein n=1 Tax=Cytobacillus firmus TaxID=1399 RepID=UPI00207A2BAD|nr:hypothetical protein [Cytobacillus firmus]USK40175.1 hypothetical protein LIS77_06660 [Cytobacillus firmus]